MEKRLDTLSGQKSWCTQEGTLHLSQSFVSLQPFEDGDSKLFESRAITKYISFEYHGKGTELVYHDGKKMATVSVWMEVEAHQFNLVAYKLISEQMAKPIIFGMETDASVVEENQAKLGQILDVYEERLSKSKYLGGDAFTLADLPHMPAIHFLMETSSKVLFEARPLVSVWIKDIMARPAWKKTIEMQKQGQI
ncbi:glutathione S-transferase-like [Telopea speciosissima]|uniref:glutathione S-transferase-like n=1 Tax=Telopea speciosissima TaxID=54955 RepID=UPI001CC71751|nr:glutathione S-transferase-like [Telopea speciosissima]